MQLGLKIETRELSRVAGLSALYAVASLIPVSAFLGGVGFISLGIVFVPVMAYLLRPKAAIVSALVGSLVVYVLQIGIGPIYGPISFLIPTSGAMFGSVGFRSRKGAFIPWGYVLFGGAFYLFSSGGTLFWLVPYLLVLVSLPLVLVQGGWSIPLLCLYATMCELATMTMASITILQLPSSLWTLITPLMFYERTLATVGSFLMITGLRKTMPTLQLK